jgi:hypothetical protein
MAKITDLKGHIRYYAENGWILSDDNKTELAGCLLNRDMRKGNLKPVELFFQEEGYYLWDLIAVYLFETSKESEEELLTELRRILIAYYEPEIELLIKEEEEIIKSESKPNPNHEYDPNLEAALNL